MIFISCQPSVRALARAHSYNRLITRQLSNVSKNGSSGSGSKVKDFQRLIAMAKPEKGKLAAAIGLLVISSGRLYFCAHNVAKFQKPY